MNRLTVFSPTPVVDLLAQSPIIEENLWMLGEPGKEIGGSRLVHTQDVEVRQAAERLEIVVQETRILVVLQEHELVLK